MFVTSQVVAILIKTMLEISKIAEGWFNQIRSEIGLLPKDIKDVAERRLKICSMCEFRKEYRCGKCGCILLAKTKSMGSTCPVNKWK